MHATQAGNSFIYVPKTYKYTDFLMLRKYAMAKEVETFPSKAFKA